MLRATAHLHPPPRKLILVSAHQWTSGTHALVELTQRIGHSMDVPIWSCERRDLPTRWKFVRQAHVQFELVDAAGNRCDESP